MDCNEARELLPLSIDRELDAKSEGELALHLASCSACDQQRQQLLSVVAGLRKAASYHRAPASLRERIETSLAGVSTAEPKSEPKTKAQNGMRWQFAWRLLNGGGLVAAVCAMFVLVLVLPQMPSNEQRMAETIVASHARALLSDHVVDVVSSDQHTVKPWFSSKLDFSPPVRDFSEQGFPLVGGRLDYIDRHPIAVLVYRRRQHLIEVFMWPTEQGGVAMSSHSIQGFHLVGGLSEGMRFVAISDVDATELKRLADLI